MGYTANNYDLYIYIHIWYTWGLFRGKSGSAIVVEPLIDMINN